jgi:hypothetical protein
MKDPDFIPLGTPVVDKEVAAKGETVTDDPDFIPLGTPVTQSQSPDGNAVEQEGDLGEAAIRGLKQTFAPFMLKKEDFSTNRTMGEMATEAGVSMAGDVATGAIAGSILGPAGSVAGALAAPVAMALYRGMGYEAARSKAQGEDFNLLRGGMNVASELNPLVAKGGRIFKFISQAALEGGREYAYTKDEDGALAAGFMGGAFGAAFHKAGPGWSAILGQPAVRPGSHTVNAGMAKRDIAELDNMLKSAEEGSLGNRLWNTKVDKIKNDPNYFELGDRLERHKDLGKGTDDFGNELRKAPKDRGQVDDFGNKIDSEKADIEGFKTWIADMPGARAKDGDVDATFEHYLKTQGQHKADGSDLMQVQKDYAVYKLQKLALEEVGKFNTDKIHGIRGATDIEDPTTGGLVDKLRDMKFQMRRIDDSTGGMLNLEGAVDRFVEAKNKQSVIMSTYLDRADKLIRAGRKEGLDNDTIGRWLSAEPGKEGSGPQLTGKQLEVAEEWRGLWEDVRQKLKQEGLDVDFIGTAAKGKDREDGWRRYLPMQSKKGANLHTSLRREMSRLEGEHGHEFLTKSDSEGLRKVAAHVLDVEPDSITTKSQIQKAMKESLKPSAKSMDGYEASATFQRTPGGEIPGFARSHDVGELFVNYLNTNMKAATHRDAMTQMASNITILRATGLDKSADYLEKYLGHMSGKPSDSMAARQLSVNKHIAKMEEMIDGLGDTLPDQVKKNFLKLRRDQSRFLGFATGQLYPNWLGWNVKAALRNYTQPWLTTAPELGHGYGMKLAAKATAETVGDFTKHKGSISPMSDTSKYKMFTDFLQKHNMSPGEHHGDAKDLSGQTMRTVKGFGGALELLDKHNNAAMWAYSLSDNVNRYITFKIGHQLAKDFAAGHPAAEKYIRRIASEGNKNALRNIVGGKSTIDEATISALGDELSKQLISKTQFHYGKESMNEYGREHGRLASMFTKWPAMVLSDSEELFRKHGGGAKGTLKVAERYLAPAAALMSMGVMLGDTAKDPKMAYLVGKNLADAAPIQSWKISAPPVLKTGVEGVTTFLNLFDNELSAAQKAGRVGDFLTDTALTYMPGTAVFNEGARMMKAGILPGGK